MLDLFLAEPAAADPGTLRPGTLRRVLCSGEALRPETVGGFFRRYGAAGPELHNLYGPTEASIDVTHWRCRPEDARGAVPSAARSPTPACSSSTRPAGPCRSGSRANCACPESSWPPATSTVPS